MTIIPASLSHPRRLALLLGGLALAAFAYLGLRGERVDVARVERGEMRQAVVASGRVRTPERIEVAAQITGRITQVAVHEGDSVAAGDVLIQFDAAEWQAGANQARAALAQAESRLRQIGEAGLPLAEQNLRQAEATLRQAERHYQRVGELVAKGFYSPAQLDDARRVRDVAASQLQATRIQVANNRKDGIEVKLARSALEQARAALAVAEAKLGYATLSSPVAARVLTRHVEPGHTAQPGKILLTLAPSGETELSAQIDEKNLALLALGQQAQVSADAYPGERFAAQLIYIAPAIDPQRGSVEIRLGVAQPPAYLRHEMTVSIDIETGNRGDTLSIPCDSVRDIDRTPWVMGVREERTVRQPVKLGLRGAGRCEIVDGLNADDAVLAAANPIGEGRRVVAVNR
jgi:HlyD family secretion protein